MCWDFILPHRQSSLQPVASCSLPMTRKSAKTTASSPPIRIAEGETESQSGQAKLAAPSLSTTALLGWGEGGTWKEIGFTRRENDGKERRERRGWITQEEDCLFSKGQTGLSSTFTYRDESALRGREVMPVYLSSSQKAGKEDRRQRGRVICWSKRWQSWTTRTTIWTKTSRTVFLPIKTSFLSRMFFCGSWAAELPPSTVLPIRSGSTGIIPRPRSLRRSSRISKSPLGPAAPASLLPSWDRKRKVRLTAGNLHLM